MVQQEDISDPESPVLYLETDLPAPEVRQVAGGLCAVYSHRCPGKTTPNEDAAALICAGLASSVLAVADGCGGMASGELASRLAIEALAQAVGVASREHTPLRAAVLDAIEQANRRIAELPSSAATTLSVVEIDGGQVRPYHVGDSLILLVGNHGKIKLLTQPHSPVGYAVASGMLDEKEAIHHDDRHLVSNVVGCQDTHIEIGSHREVAARDTLLVASDGLADNLHVEEIVELIRKGPLGRAASKLAAAAHQRMQANEDDTAPSKPDDLTFILFRPK